MEVIVSKGELSTIMGLMNYANARLALKAPGCTLEPGGILGAAIIELLDTTNGVDLYNPEVVGLCDLLLANGLIDMDCRGRIATYVNSKLSSLPPDPTELAYNYRVPLTSVPAGQRAIDWIGQYMTAVYQAWIVGEYLHVSTDGVCTAPGTEAA